MTPRYLVQLLACSGGRKYDVFRLNFHMDVRAVGTLSRHGSSKYSSVNIVSALSPNKQEHVRVPKKWRGYATRISTVGTSVLRLKWSMAE